MSTTVKSNGSSKVRNGRGGELLAVAPISGQGKNATAQARSGLSEKDIKSLVASGEIAREYAVNVSALNADGRPLHRSAFLATVAVYRSRFGIAKDAKEQLPAVVYNAIREAASVESVRSVSEMFRGTVDTATREIPHLYGKGTLNAIPVIGGAVAAAGKRPYTEAQEREDRKT